MIEICFASNKSINIFEIISHPGKIWKKVLPSEASRRKPKRGVELEIDVIGDDENIGNYDEEIMKMRNTIGVGLAGCGVDEIRSGS